MQNLFYNSTGCVPLPALAAERGRHAEADALAASMYAGQTSWQARTRVEDAKRRAAFETARLYPDAFSALQRLVYGNTTSHFASLNPVFTDWGPQPGNTGMDALVQFALLSPFWIRLPEKWTHFLPAGNNKRAALASLARHLFCRYDVPAPFDRAWMGGWDAFSDTFRRAFVHLGQGGKLEAVPFPCPLSHRAAHYFMHAPPDFPLPAALRWGQIKALNGHENLAYTLRETVLQNAQPDEAFWFSFVQFLINYHDAIPLWQEACEKGKTSVWSLRVALFDPNAPSGSPKPVSRRLLTLEVNNHRRAVVQVRGKCNQTLPDLRAKNQRMKNARDVLRDWAIRERLGISCAI